MPLTIFFTLPGTYTIEDDGTRGNNTSQVRDQNGIVLLPFVHPGDTINFLAGVPGITFVFNTSDTFGTADITVGSLTDTTVTPDSVSIKYMRTDAFMTLASNGSITEGGSDAAADLIAAGLIMSAATGIGTAANALEAQTTFIEAKTNTGGINLVNSGPMQIGGLSGDVAGLVVGDTGDINLSTVGLILLADGTGASSVQGGNISGNVNLTAIGVDSDIFSNIDQPSIRAAGGGITLNAGRDVSLGTSGTNFNNDLLATGPIAIHAGRDFQLDGTSDLRTGAFGGVVGGNIEIDAGRNINLSNLTGGLQTIQAFVGDVILTTGPGGVFFENAAFPGAVSTTNNIILNTDNAQINSGGMNTTGVGSVTIVPVTPGRAIDLGTALDGPAALGLSDDEFDLLFTLNVNIGDANSGPVTFSAPLSPFIVDNLTVTSGTEILVNSSVTLPRLLSLTAGDDVYFTASANVSSTNDGLQVFVDANQNDGGAGGVADLSRGTFSVNYITITGNKDSDTLIGSMIDDTLNGASDADTMRGLDGDDTYVVDNAGDVVDESGAISPGIDRVKSSISFDLSDSLHVFGEVENLTLTGGAAINATGNSLANTLIGNAAANTLDGHEGADIMRGLGGGDTYIVDDPGDMVDESGANSGGIDTVLSSVSFSFSDAAQAKGTLENLTLTGAADIDATGNSAANTLTGNSGANTLNGRAGADIMRGLGGNDTYIVDTAGDVVDESAAGSGGIDTVRSSVSFSFADGVHAKGRLENLTLTGAATINGTGDGAENVIVGNDGDNVLNGRAGSDTLTGRLGNDTFRFDTALDAASNVDHITDFDVDGPGADSFDTIELENAIFTALTATGNLKASKFAVVASAADFDKGSIITYVSSTGDLYYDTNGSSAGGATLFATLGAGLALTNADFFVT